MELQISHHHNLSCPRRAFPTNSHNEIRNLLFRPSLEVRERAYSIEYIVEIEHGSFTRKSCVQYHWRHGNTGIKLQQTGLALAEKCHHQPYATMMGWLCLVILLSFVINLVYPWHSIKAKWHSCTSCILQSGCWWITHHAVLFAFSTIMLAFYMLCVQSDVLYKNYNSPLSHIVL